MATSIGEIEATLRLKDELTAQLGRAQSALEGFAGKTQAMGASMQSIGNAAVGLGTSLTVGLTLPIVGAFTKLVSSSSEFQSAFANVRKTIGDVPELPMIRESIRGLSRELPQSASQLASFAAVGGQFGISASGITEFTRTVAALDVAVDGLSAEQAAEGLAQIRNITGDSEANIGNMAATLVALGNAGSSTEQQILDFTQRLSGIGKTVGLTTPEIFALGATLANLGINAELGATAMQTTFVDMAKAVSHGGDELKTFDQVAQQGGLAAGQFATAFKEKPIEAMGAFITGLSNIKASGGDVIAALGTLGVEGQRQLATLLQTASASGNLSSAQGNLAAQVTLAGNAFAAGNAHLEEARLKNETFANQLARLGNILADVFRPIGDDLVRMLTGMVNAFAMLIPVIEPLVKAFVALPDPLKLVVFGFVAMAASIGPLTVFFGFMTKGMGQVLELAVQLATKIPFVATAFRTLATAIGAGDLIGKASMMTTATTTAATATKTLTMEAAMAGPAIAQAGRAIAQSGTAAGEAASGVGLFARAWGGIVAIFGDVWPWLARIGASLLSWPVAIAAVVAALATWIIGWENIKSVASGLWDVLSDLASIIGSVLVLAFQQVAEWAQAFWDVLKGFAGWVASSFNGAMVSIRQSIIDSFKDEPLMMAFFEGIKLQAKGAKDAISNLAGNLNDRTKGIVGRTQGEGFKPEDMAPVIVPGIGFSPDELVKPKTPPPPDFGAMDKAKQKAEELKKALDRLTGKDVVAAANELVKQVGMIGGAAAIAPGQIDSVHKALDDALEVMASQGKVANDAMIRLWLNTMPPIEVVEGIEGLGKTLKDFGKPIPGLADMFGQLTKGGPLDLSSILGGGSFTGVSAGSGVKLPGFFARALGDSKTMGAELGKTLIDAITGGGNIAAAAIGSLGNKLGKGLSDTLGSAMKGSTGFLASGFGSLLGGAAQAILPGIGALLGPLAAKVGEFFGKLFDRNKGRDLVEGFAEDQGGFDELHKKLGELGAEGEQLWIRLTQGVGRNNPEQAKAAIEAVTEALERQSHIMEHINGIVGGTNDRAKNLTTQGDLDVVSAGAVASFALLVQQGTSAVEALNMLNPALTAMRDATAGGNLALGEAGMHLMAINTIVSENSIAFQNLAATGQIVNAMLDGNIVSSTLFAAAARDIGTQIQGIIDRGVPMEQALALAQPQIQALWEAQQKFGFATDATTQAIIDQAVAQGIVGEQMKSVNQQILDVLLAIADVFGATIPSAMAGLPAAANAAASGMQEAFDRVRAPSFDETGRVPDTVEDIPALADGAIVRARTGGTLVRVGEGGSDEAVVPLDGSVGGSGGTVIVEIEGQRLAELLVPHIPGVVTRYGVG